MKPRLTEGLPSAGTERKSVAEFTLDNFPLKLSNKL